MHGCKLGVFGSHKCITIESMELNTIFVIFVNIVHSCINCYILLDRVTTDVMAIQDHVDLPEGL